MEKLDLLWRFLLRQALGALILPYRTAPADLLRLRSMANWDTIQSARVESKRILA